MVEQGNYSLSNEIQALSAKTAEMEKQEAGLLAAWYEQFFKIATGLTPEQKNRELYFQTDIQPYCNSTGVCFDDESIGWLANFHNNRNVSIDYVKGSATKEQDITEQNESARITLRSRVNPNNVAILTVRKRTEGSQGFTDNQYQMHVSKMCDFNVDKVPRNADEFDDLAKVSELRLIQIACVIAYAFSQTPTQEATA